MNDELIDDLEWELRAVKAWKHIYRQALRYACLTEEQEQECINTAMETYRKEIQS